MVSAAVTVDDQRGSFVPTKGPSEGVDTRGHERNGLHDRVLRAFLNSVLGLTVPSDTISAASSANCRLIRSCLPAVVPQLLRICATHGAGAMAFLIARLEYLEVGLRCVPVRNIHASFATTSVQPIKDRSLEKRRMVSFNAVAEKKEHPSAYKKIPLPKSIS